MTAEAGPSPSHLPSSLRHPWGQFPETGYGPPNQLGTVSAPVGQVSQGTHRLQVCGGCRPPIQCEGFLCSVVFLTPEGGGSLGEAQAAPAAGLAPVPVCAVAPLGQLVRSRPRLRHPRGLGTHVFGLRPAVLRPPPEGVGRWRVPEGVRVWEQGPGRPAGRRLWRGQGRRPWSG